MSTDRFVDQFVGNSLDVLIFLPIAGFFHRPQIYPQISEGYIEANFYPIVVFFDFSKYNLLHITTKEIRNWLNVFVVPIYIGVKQALTEKYIIYTANILARE